MARPIDEVRTMMVERAQAHRNPFTSADPSRVEAALNSLTSLEPEAWVWAFTQLAALHEAAAKRADDPRIALREYMLAYEYWRVARYPAPNSPAKRTAYRTSQHFYLEAARYFDPPLKRVRIPFPDGGEIVGDLRKPADHDPPHPLVIHWGGIDSYKEERRSEPYLGVGLAALAIDMPGVGDAPIIGSHDAERLWDPVFQWIEGQPELDARRVAVHGGSTGGYWAAKLAHTHRDRLRAVVDHGGPAHHAFRPEWIEKAQRGEYPFELAETLASAFGGTSFDDWLAMAPSLSLLKQGILDGPSAPMLLVNGVHDTIFPIEDLYLLLEHGTPKTARFFAEQAHMGGPGAMDVIVSWLESQLT